MVEDVPDTTSLGDQGLQTLYRTRLRGVFFKNGNDWSPMCQNDEHATANVCPEKNVSQFTSSSLYQLEYRHAIRVAGVLKRENCCSEVGWLEADRIDLLELDGDRLLKHSPTMVYEPVRRPKAISNQPKRIENPDRWRRAKNAGVSNSAAKMIMDQFNRESFCYEAVEKPMGERQVIKLKVASGDLRVVQTWRNRRGVTLIEIDLSPRFHARCKTRKGTTGEASIVWPSAWVAVAPNHAPVVHSQKLRIGYERLQPLEFGDFDGDGESEALFQLDGYNRAGYVLLYSKLAKRAQFIWSFH